MKCCHSRIMQISALLILFITITGCGRTPSKAVASGTQQSSLTVKHPAPPPEDQPALVLQYSHSSDPHDIAFAAKAPIFASSDGDGYIDIWNTRSWTLERTIDTDTPMMTRNYNTKGIALSPDGKFLAYLTSAGEVQIWNTSSGNMIKKLPKPVGLPVSVKWSPDGLRIAAGSTDAVRLWDVASGEVLRSFPAAGDVAFSRSGKILGTAGESTAYLFDIASGKKIRSFSDKAGVRWPIAISPDGRYIATGGEDPNWDPGPLPRDEEGNEFAPTESFYSHELKVKIWDTRTGRRIKMLPGHNNLGGGTVVLQFTPDSRRLFSGGEGYAALWDVRSKNAVKNFDNAYASAISPDGRMMAISKPGMRSELKVYSVATGKNLMRLHAPPSPVRSLAFSLDGNVLAEGDENSDSTSLRLWDVTNGKLIHALAGPTPNLHQVGFLGNHRVFSSSLNGTYIWNSATGKVLKKYRGPKENPINIPGFGTYQWQLLTPDGSYLVYESGEESKRSYIFQDAATGKVHTTITPKPGGSLSNAVFSQNGWYFAVPTREYPEAPTIEIWDIRTGKRVSRISNIGTGTVLLFFSQDGKNITGSLPSPIQMPEGKQVTVNKIIVWDVASGKEKQQLNLGEKSARSIAFSPDGRTLAAGISADIYLYDAKSLQPTEAMSTGKSEISALAFSPDGTRIAAGYDDGSVRLWDVQSNDLLITMVGFTTEGQGVSQDWVAYTPDGRYNWSPGAANLIRWRCKGKLYPANTFADKLKREKLLK